MRKKEFYKHPLQLYTESDISLSLSLSVWSNIFAFIQTSVEKNSLYTFSDVGVLLMEDKPKLLAEVLAALVMETHALDLQEVLQVCTLATIAVVLVMYC